MQGSGAIVEPRLDMKFPTKQTIFAQPWRRKDKTCRIDRVGSWELARITELYIVLSCSVAVFPFYKNMPNEQSRCRMQCKWKADVLRIMNMNSRKCRHNSGSRPGFLSPIRNVPCSSISPTDSTCLFMIHIFFQASCTYTINIRTATTSNAVEKQSRTEKNNQFLKYNVHDAHIRKYN